MIKSVATACVLMLASSAAVQAELLDVVQFGGPGDTQLWLSFDTQPHGAHIETDNGIVLHVEGVSTSNTRHLEPAIRGPLSHLQLSSTQTGVQITLSGSFTSAISEVREGGVLVTLEGVTGMSAPIVPAGSQNRMPASEHHEGDTGENADRAPLGGQASGPDTALNASTATTNDGAAQTRGPAATSDDTICPDTASRLAASPWDLNHLTGHADCLFNVGETDNAVGLYEQVLAFEPSHFQASLGLARIRSDRGEHEAAAVLFETAASSARTDGQAVQARMAARRAREMAEQ